MVAMAPGRYRLLLAVGIVAAGCAGSGGPDGGMPKQTLGGPCAADSDCAPALQCLPELPGGLCSRQCDEIIGCGNAALCVKGFCHPACRSDADCRRGPPFVCVSGACASGPSPTLPPAHCADGARDQDETDIDCGGPLCDPCRLGLRCAEARDCVSKTCASGICAAEPWCGDGIKDKDETAIDCGGPSCPACADGRACLAASDCQTSGCANGICTHCANLYRDFDETDTDCGGKLCHPCRFGLHCTKNSDCAFEVCSNGVCGLPAYCSDGKKDQDETDIDCGGPTCFPCLDGRACLTPRDCRSQGCAGGKCNHCVNGMRDGDEADIDCGGPDCAPCGPRSNCFANRDCLSACCLSRSCAPASCCDGKRDGDESDIDCGGPSCARCEQGRMCGQVGDCVAPRLPGFPLDCIGGVCDCQRGMRYVGGGVCVCDAQSCGQCCGTRGCGPDNDGTVYCGSAGAMCLPCNSPGFGCFEGDCVPLCGGMFPCNTCCVGDQFGGCMDRDDDRQCGVGGRICFACWQGKHCVKGVCQ